MRAIAKAILFGEHSVVYGYKAIAIPLKEIYLTARIQKKYSPENSHIKYIKKLLGIKDYVVIDSKIPSSRGLGSSAALSIAMARLTDKNVIEIANIAEKMAHGNPSGIDVAVISSEKAIIYQKGAENIFFETNLNAYLVIVDTGIKGNTKLAVEKVKNINRMDIIEKLGEITQRAIIEINNKNVAKIGELFKEAQENLRKLELSNEKIDFLCEEMNKYSYGSKITGSGCGGCIIAICKNYKSANILKRNIMKKGIKNIWITKV